MPIFDTRCTKCGHVEEIILPMSAPELPVCHQIAGSTLPQEGEDPEPFHCHGQREKLFSAPARAQFRGGGWTPPRLTGGRTE